MNNARRRNAYLNIVFALFLQLISAISGILLPRFFISQYGSEVNGLISSITQFLAYISLLEAGVGGVIRAALYKPLAENDTLRISGIIKASKKFYNRIGLIFLLYLLILCFVYPILAATNFSPFFIISMILILSVSTCLQYFVSLPYVALVTADQKVRIVYALDSITIILNIIISLVLIYAKAPIHVVKAVGCIVFAVKPLFLYLYVKTKYEIDKKCEADDNAIKQRWNGLAHHIAFFIHSNTDIFILTMFTDLATVSVYSIYRAVVVGIEKLVMSVSDGCAAGIGNLLVSGSKNEIDNSINLFEFVQCSLSTVFFTITALMIIPFFNIYSKGITDANYIQPLFAFLLVISEFIYCIRVIYSTIALNAGKYKETQKGAIIECVVNLTVSIILVKKLGLIGVAIGTAVAMLIRCLFDVYFLSQNLIYRRIKCFVKIVSTSILAGGASIFVCQHLLNYEIFEWGQWFINAVLSSLIVCIISAVVYMLFYRAMMTNIIKGVFRKLKRT